MKRSLQFVCPKVAFTLLFLLSGFTFFGQISIGSGALPYSKSDNFNSYNPTSAGTATSTIPAGWTYSSTAAAYLGQGTGTANSGGFYSYGTAGDFSLGALASGTSDTRTYTLSFTNNSGSTITSITLAWDYEQWRYAGNTSGWNLTGTGQLAANATLNAKDFSGVASGTNGTVAVTPVASFTLSGLNITNGQSFGFTWVTTNLSGTDNGVSIDNFSMTASATVPLAPEINLQGNSVSIVNNDITPATGDHTDFGSVAIGDSVTRTFTIQNTGTATLTLDSPAVELSASNDFNISTPAGTTTLAGGASTTFQVTFNPTSGGSQANTILIGSDDADEGVYAFNIQGTATIGTPVAQEETNYQSGSFDANWDAVANALSYRLDVSTNAAFTGTSTNLATWNFPSNPDNATVDSGTATNSTKTLTLTGASLIGYTTGSSATTSSASSDSWVSGSGTKYWQVEVTTTGYNDIKVSSKQQGSNTGPRDFKLQYKIGSGGTYTDVTGGAITVANNWTTGVLTNVTLPSACDNQTSVFLRWIMTSNNAISGSLAVGGTSRIDDIVITGTTPGFVAGYEDLNVGNVTTYPVTGLTNGITYYYRVRAVNGIASANSGTITVAPVSIGGTVASPQTICSGTQPATLNLTGHVGNVLRWEKAADLAFTAPTTISNTTTTLTGATIGNLTATTYFRAVVQNGAATPANSAAVAISIDPAAVGGTVNGATTVCGTTNSGTLTLSGQTGSVIGWESSLDGFATAGTPIANTTTTLNYTNITVATSFRAIVQTGGCSATSSIATIAIGTSTTWDGVSWSNGSPTADKAAIFAADFNAEDHAFLDAQIYACSVSVTNNATVYISNGYDLISSGGVSVEAGSNLYIRSNANLLQLNDNDNTDAIYVNRNSSALMRLDYTLWSSPVAGQNLLAFSPNTITTRFYTYNTLTNQYNSIAPSNSFAEGKGYLIRMPDDHSADIADIWPGEFFGVPHNGPVNVTMANDGAGKRFNLVGNPYPSAIDMATFVSNNSGNITGTLYFWRKTNNALSPSYCTWSTLGFVTNNEEQVEDPNGIIRTGQGFLVEAAGNATSVSFNNGQRVSDNTGQFFRMAEIEKNRIWLNVSNADGAFSQTLVGYIGGATAGLDSGIDGKYMNDGPVALTSVIEDASYAIQGRALPFDAADIVPLGFKAVTAGNYTIAIDHVDGLFLGNQVSIFLKDNNNGAMHELNSSAYTFASEAGTFNSRFELVYQTALAVQNPVFNDNSVVVYKSNGNIVINSGIAVMDNVKIFDIRGRLIAEKKSINASETIIPADAANQVLIVKITSDTNQAVTKKVVN